MRSLRSLVRVSSRISASAAGNDGNQKDLAREYGPFPACGSDGGNGNVLPCCHEMLAGHHPAADGLRLAIRALTIMDIFCGPALGDWSWDILFESCTGEDNVDAEDATKGDGDAAKYMKFEQIRQGMRGRKSLVESIVLSLRGEITARWAAEDRLARSDVGALLCDDAGIDEAERDGEDQVENGPAKAHHQSFDPRSYNRLALLVDRILYARILSSIYQQRRQYDLVAKVVMGYIASAMPSLGSEDYPQHSPVLSFCVLEALMHPSAGRNKSCFDLSLCTGAPSDSGILGKVLQLIVRSAMKIWTVRKSSTDGRIRDISRAELAAFNRIVQNQDVSFLSTGEMSALDEEEVLLQQARDIASAIVEQGDSAGSPSNEDSALPLMLSLILIGDISLVADISSKTETKFVDSNGSGRFVFSSVLLACCQAFQAIRCRNSRAHPDDYSGNDLSSKLDSVLENLKTADNSDDVGYPMCMPIIARCSAVLTDGLGINSAATSQSPVEANVWMQATEMIDSSYSIPMIRVINLERRSDRWDAIRGQARASRLLVVRGPASLLESCDIEDKAYWGNYAFDGRGDIDFTGTAISFEGASIRLNDFVATHWYPSELRAFDKNAKEEEVSVPASATERACALSHIASWKGVERSLRCTMSFNQGNSSLTTATEASARRLLRISGFATGPALLHENRAMDPAPVCVIMEDDAILVDRFRDRLAALLHELPRDFHFCSLGYGRPKNAPMIEFSKEVGIPTFLWYMTGYILSMEGARVLLDGLPVVGPVDSWIGLKISSNWENEYGYAIGVGRDARKSNKTAMHVGAVPQGVCASGNMLARKDLARLMKFRAFAALVPLCSQKVGQGYAGADAPAHVTNKRIVAKWRDRDSDIVYSGVGK